MAALDTESVFPGNLIPVKDSDVRRCPMVKLTFQEPLHSTRVFKRISGFRYREVFPAHFRGSLHDLLCLQNRIRHYRTAVGRHHIHQIRHRPPEIRTRIDPFYPKTDTVQRPYISCVAVRIPCRRSRNADGLLKIVAAQDECRNDHGMIRNHMTAPRINVITVFRVQICPDLPPVCLFAADVPDVPDDIQQFLTLHISGRPVQKHVNPFFLKSHRFQSRQMAGSLHRDPVVADAGRIPDQFHRCLRISRTCHGDRVNKDLCADLLCQNLSIDLGGAAFWRFYPVFQIEIRGMFRRSAQSAPPQDRFIFYDIIEPCISECLRRRIFFKSMILNSPEKTKCTGNVIVRHDQGNPCFFMDVIPDLSKGILDFLITPPFHGSSQIYAEYLSKHSGIYIVFIFLYTHRSTSTAFIFMLFPLQTRHPVSRRNPLQIQPARKSIPSPLHRVRSLRLYTASVFPL